MTAFLPQKICLFIESGGPGGAERVVVELAKSLRAAGIEVCVATLRSGWLTETLRAQGIRHELIQSAGSRDWALPWRMARFFVREGFEVIHSHLLDSNFYCTLAARIAGIPHVATEHGDVHHTDAKKYLRIKLQIINRLCSKLTAVSSYTAETLVDLGVSREKIAILPNPIPAGTDVVRDAAERNRLRRDIFGAAESDWIWLHAANLRPVKDQSTLVRGFAASLAATGPVQLLCIAGDGRVRSELEELIRSLGAEDRVKLLGFRDDVPSLLAAADGFALTSRSEALPMSLLEAADAGLFLLSTDVGGVRDVLSPDYAALVPPGNPPVLAQAMTKAVSDRNAALQMAKAGQEAIRSRFSLAAVTASYIEIYRVVVAATFAPAPADHPR